MFEYGFFGPFLMYFRGVKGNNRHKHGFSRLKEGVSNGLKGLLNKNLARG